MTKRDSHLKDMWYKRVIVLMLVLVELLQVGQVLIFTVLCYLMPHLSLLFCLDRQKTQETESKKDIEIISERKGQGLTNKTTTFMT